MYKCHNRAPNSYKCHFLPRLRYSRSSMSTSSTSKQTNEIYHCLSNSGAKHLVFKAVIPEAEHVACCCLCLCRALLQMSKALSILSWTALRCNIPVLVCNQHLPSAAVYSPIAADGLISWNYKLSLDNNLTSCQSLHDALMVRDSLNHTCKTLIHCSAAA